MESPRRKIVMALNGSETTDLTHDELMVYEMVCHLEACAIAGVPDKNGRRAMLYVLPINMQASVKAEVERIFEISRQTVDNHP